jgi:hypothetical protein
MARSQVIAVLDHHLVPHAYPNVFSQVVDGETLGAILKREKPSGVPNAYLAKIPEFAKVHNVKILRVNSTLSNKEVTQIML